MEGIFVGVILSIIFVMSTTAFPHVAHLGQMKGSESMNAQGKYSMKSVAEHGKEGRIYWRNIERFDEVVFTAGNHDVSLATRGLQSRHPPRQWGTCVGICCTRHGCGHQDGRVESL